MKRLIPIAVAICALTAVAQAEEPATLRMGVIANSARSISQLGLTLAQRKGFLAHEGVRLEIVPLPGVHHQVEALDRGEVHVSHTATPYLIQAVLKGSDAVAIVGGLANPVFAILAKPEIKSYSDLRGKVIALSLPVDTITIGTVKLLERAGLNRSDFVTRELIGTPVRVKCLVSGECDAAPVGQPDDLILAEKGYSNLGNSLEVFPALQFNVIAANRKWAEANQTVVMKYVRAFGAAYRYMSDPANRGEVANVIADMTGAPRDIAEKILRFYFEPFNGSMPRSAEIDMAGMTAVISLMGTIGELQPPLPPAEQFVDLRYLKAAGLQ